MDNLIDDAEDGCNKEVSQVPMDLNINQDLTKPLDFLQAQNFVRSIGWAYNIFEVGL